MNVVSCAIDMFVAGRSMTTYFLWFCKVMSVNFVHNSFIFEVYDLKCNKGMMIIILYNKYYISM